MGPRPPRQQNVTLTLSLYKVYKAKTILDASYHIEVCLKGNYCAVVPASKE